MNKQVLLVSCGLAMLGCGAEVVADDTPSSRASSSLSVQTLNVRGLSATASLLSNAGDGCESTRIDVYGAEDMATPGSDRRDHYRGAWVGFYRQNVCTNVWTLGEFFAEPAPFDFKGAANLDSASLDCTFEVRDALLDPTTGQSVPIADRAPQQVKVHLVWKGVGSKFAIGKNVSRVHEPTGSGYFFHYIGLAREAELTTSVVSVDGLAMGFYATGAWLQWAEIGELTLTRL